MTKEKMFEKFGLVLENFNPVPNASIKVTIDPEVIDLDTTAGIVESLREIYPDHGIFVILKGVDVQ